MENIIKLGREDEEKFSTFIKKSRKELILNPKLTFLQALEKNKIKLSISSISQNIRDLRQSSYDLFLEQENHFNAYVLKNIADNFSLPKPKNLENMFNIAQTLSMNLPYSRIDLYNPL